MGIEDTRGEGGYKSLYSPGWLMVACSAFWSGWIAKYPECISDLVMYLQLQVIIIGRKRRGTPLMSRS